MNIIEEIRSIFRQSKEWISLEVEYAKLTIAEKLTVLLSSLIIGFVCLLFGSVALVMLSMAVAEAFKLILSPALAYVCTAGSVLVLVLLIYLLRNPLLLNPIAKLISKVFFDKKHS